MFGNRSCREALKAYVSRRLLIGPRLSGEVQGSVLIGGEESSLVCSAVRAEAAESDSRREMEKNVAKPNSRWRDPSHKGEERTVCIDAG